MYDQWYTVSMCVFDAAGDRGTLVIQKILEEVFSMTPRYGDSYQLLPFHLHQTMSHS